MKMAQNLTGFSTAVLLALGLGFAQVACGGDEAPPKKEAKKKGEPGADDDEGGKKKKAGGGAKAARASGKAAGGGSIGAYPKIREEYRRELKERDFRPDILGDDNR